MIPRAIYYRKKNKTIVIEGRQGRKSVLIWTLPQPEKLLSTILQNPSLFTEEKQANIKEKIARLDYKASKVNNGHSKVRLPHIRRTQEKDGMKGGINTNGEKSN